MVNTTVKFRKPNNVSIWDMSDADYLAHIAEKIMKGQRPKATKTSDRTLDGYQVTWSTDRPNPDYDDSIK